MRHCAPQDAAEDMMQRLNITAELLDVNWEKTVLYFKYRFTNHSDNKNEAQVGSDM